ncbi:general substrate transporter, partial [Phaeosphaeriaceae sp. PMI808]
VKRFVSQTDLSDLTQTIFRGAYLAEDPDNYPNVEGLTSTEIAALKREDEERRSLKILAKVPKQLRTIIITCSVAAIAQGWDQVSMSAANQYWPAELGLDMQKTRDIWLFGIINASSFLFASMVGAWLSDPLNEFLAGRRPVIFIAAIFSLIPVIGAAVCQNWTQLLICRLLLGVGMGCKAAVVPIYAAETAPTSIRGGVVMNWQLSLSIGGFIGSSFNLALFDIVKFNWRLQLAVASLPAILLLFLIYACPESPRFLIKKGKWRQAYESLRSLNDTDVQAARELFLIHVQNDRKNPLNDHISTYIKRLVNLVSVPRIRRATTAAAVVMISQQLCGVNIIALYSGTLLPQTDPNDPKSVRTGNKNGLWLGFGCTVFPAFLAIDRYGRRTLCLFTTPILGLCLFAGGFCFWIEPHSKAYLGSLFPILFVYLSAYQLGLGVVPFTYSAEVFPTVNREAGMSLAVFINLFGAGILSLFVPSLQVKLGALGLFELFAGLNVLAYVLMFAFVYETKKERLETLDLIFEINVRTHLQYQLGTVVPWCLKNTFRARQ